jgi:hypothetical protein
MKIEKRFGFRELPETAQVQFSNARQTPSLFMLMPPHFVNGLFYVFRPDIGCIASGFLICCPMAEPHYHLLVHVFLWQFSKSSSSQG